jgi:hypothetical protein
MFRFLAEVIWEFLIGRTIERILPAVMPKGNPFDDPVYKKNVQDLIERNRRFEKKE